VAAPSTRQHSHNVWQSSPQSEPNGNGGVDDDFELFDNVASG
jgi:hypothetical protein